MLLRPHYGVECNFSGSTAALWWRIRGILCLEGCCIEWERQPHISKLLQGTLSVTNKSFHFRLNDRSMVRDENVCRTLTQYSSNYVLRPTDRYFNIRPMKQEKNWN